ncbi:MAG: hypothetical protein IJK17_03350 [Lachnospiraceae bacterium]|nr:hypothetical protein [Lachnospiraceae bacterium]
MGQIRILICLQITHNARNHNAVLQHQIQVLSNLRSESASNRNQVPIIQLHKTICIRGCQAIQFSGFTVGNSVTTL